MKSKRNLLLKNSQRGASVVEVIFAIGIVIAVTPFIYTQLSDMTRVVSDVARANEITKTRDLALNYILANQNSFTETETTISDEVLSNIAPSAEYGVVHQTTIEGDDKFKNTEMYLVFKNPEIDKYRTANVAKYIGDDAATVQEVTGDSDLAHAREWSVGLPDEWCSDTDNCLVYRVTRNFGGEDESLYLHFSDSGSGFSTMNRPLHMYDGVNHWNLENVMDFDANKIITGNVATPEIETHEVTAGDILFSSGANINLSNLEFNSLNARDVYDFNKVNTDKLCKKNEECDLSACSVFVDDGYFYIDSGVKVSDFDIHAKHFDYNALRAREIHIPNIFVDLHQGYYNCIFSVSNDGTYDIRVGDWTYRETDPLFSGPTFENVQINGLDPLQQLDWVPIATINDGVSFILSDCCMTTSNCVCN